MIPLSSFIYGVVEEIKEECWFDLEKFDGEDLFKNWKDIFLYCGWGKVFLFRW